MKVIFLDIDGVLNVNSSERDEYGQLFHKHFVDNLEKIIYFTGAKIVISSTWRLSGLDVMKEMWAKRDLPGEVIDVTSFIFGGKRGYEIAHWLCDREIDGYVIIDDDLDFLENQFDHLVRTSNNKDSEGSIGGLWINK